MALRAGLQVLVRPSRLSYAARRFYSDFDHVRASFKNDFFSVSVFV